MSSRAKAGATAGARQPCGMIKMECWFAARASRRRSLPCARARGSTTRLVGQNFHAGPKNRAKARLDGLRRSARGKVRAAPRGHRGVRRRGKVKARSLPSGKYRDSGCCRYNGGPASGAAKDATKPVLVVFARWRSGPRFVLRATNPAKGIEGGSGRDKKALQQKRAERDHADRDALHLAFGEAFPFDND